MVVALVMAGTVCSCCPSRSDVDGVLAKLPSQRPEDRTTALTALLDRLRKSNSAEDEAVHRYALGRLEGAYASTKDASILEALDRTRIEGGFANDVCGTYVRLLGHPEARERYAGRTGPVARCVGITFSDAELRDLLSSKGPNPDAGSKRTP